MTLPITRPCEALFVVRLLDVPSDEVIVVAERFVRMPIGIVQHWLRHSRPRMLWLSEKPNAIELLVRQLRQTTKYLLLSEKRWRRARALYTWASVQRRSGRRT